MKKLATLALIGVLSLTLFGCAAKSATTAANLPPGALNAFDAQTYVDLMGTQAVINSLKADLAAGTIPAAAKSALNTAIASYNIAETAWQAYHATGVNQPAAQAAVTKAKNDTATALAAVSGGK
jgi:hypothetical protein